MNEQNATDPSTGLDKSFAALRGLGVRRRTDDKWIAGVCSGVADRFGVDPVIVRAGLVLLSLLWGFGVTLYLVAWALLPNDRDEIVAERALRDGDGGAIVVMVLAGFALFGGSWWSTDSGWGFPWPLVLTGLLIWWVVQRSRHQPGADQRVSAQQSTAPNPAGPSPTQFASGPAPTAFAAGPAPTAFAAGPAPTPYPYGPSPTPARPVVPSKPRRRSGGPLMALVAIGLALVTYGALSWMGTQFAWTGDHRAIAIAGSLATIGLLLVVLGFAGWRAGFVAFLAVVLAITAFTSTVVPKGIFFGGRVGDETWTPTSVTAYANYRLGAGNGVLDLSRLPLEGLSEAQVPAYVGLGELKVIVPEGLTVKVVGHVGLGEILLPSDRGENGQGGTDVDREIVMGDGPTEVVVNAGVGLGQLTVVKE